MADLTFDDLDAIIFNRMEADESFKAEGDRNSLSREASAGWQGLKADYARGLSRVTGSSALEVYARDREHAAQLEAQASTLPQSYREVDGVGSALGYTGHLLASSAPQMATILAGAGAAGVAARGLGLAGRGLAAAQTAGGAATTYPSEFGSFAKIMEDEAAKTGEEASLGTAAALALPSAALNVAGVGGIAARRALPGAGTDVLKAVMTGSKEGVAGGVETAIKAGVRTGAEEAAAEASQAALRGVGRYEARGRTGDILDDATMAEIEEGAIGGFSLGGLLGGIGGARRGRKDRLEFESLQKERAELSQQEADEALTRDNERKTQIAQLNQLNLDRARHWVKEKIEPSQTLLIEHHPTRPGQFWVAPRGEDFNAQQAAAGEAFREGISKQPDQLLIGQDKADQQLLLEDMRNEEIRREEKALSKAFVGSTGAELRFADMDVSRKQTKPSHILLGAMGVTSTTNAWANNIARQLQTLMRVPEADWTPEHRFEQIVEAINDAALAPANRSNKRQTMLANAFNAVNMWHERVMDQRAKEKASMQDLFDQEAALNQEAAEYQLGKSAILDDIHDPTTQENLDASRLGEMDVARKAVAKESSLLASAPTTEPRAAKTDTTIELAPEPSALPASRKEIEVKGAPASKDTSDYDKQVKTDLSEGIPSAVLEILDRVIANPNVRGKNPVKFATLQLKAAKLPMTEDYKDYLEYSILFEQAEAQKAADTLKEQQAKDKRANAEAARHAPNQDITLGVKEAQPKQTQSAPKAPVKSAAPSAPATQPAQSYVKRPAKAPQPTKASTAPATPQKRATPQEVIAALKKSAADKVQAAEAERREEADKIQKAKAQRAAKRRARKEALKGVTTKGEVSRDVARKESMESDNVRVAEKIRNDASQLSKQAQTFINKKLDAGDIAGADNALKKALEKKPAKDKFSMRGFQGKSQPWTATTHPGLHKIEGVVKDLVSTWSRPPNVMVLNSQTLPKWLRERLEKGDGMANGKLLVDGMYGLDHQGSPTVFLFTDHMQSWEHVEATVFHEALGHYGLSRILGRHMGAVLKNIYDTNATFRALVDEHADYLRGELARVHGLTGKDYDAAIAKPLTETDMATAREEVIARASEEGTPTFGFFEKARAILRDLGRKFGWVKAWTNQDINYLIYRSHQSVVEGGGSSANVLAAQEYDSSVKAEMDALSMGEKSGADKYRRLSNSAHDRVMLVKNEMVRDYLSDVKAAMTAMAKKGMLGSMFTRDLIAYIKNNNLLKGIADYETAVHAQEVTTREMNERTNDLAIQAHLLSEPHRDAVMAALREATTNNEWAFEPDWIKDVYFDPASKAAHTYDAMTKDQQALYRGMLKHQYDTRTAIQSEIISQIEAAGKRAADAARSPEAQKAAKIRTRDQLAQTDAIFNMIPGPYMPLSRFGSHVVIGRSAEVTALEKRITKAENEGLTKDASDLRNELSNLQLDPAHYYVAFEPGTMAARRAKRALEADPALKTLTFEEPFEREQVFSKFQGAPWQALQKLRAELDAGLIDENASDDEKRVADSYTAKFMGMLNDLYFQSLAESSSRRHDISRRGIAGASTDMMRAFITKSRSDAMFLGTVKHSSAVSEAMSKMRKSTGNVDDMGGTRDDRKKAYLEILKRRVLSMESAQPGWQDKAMIGTSLWMLLSSPKYYLMNAAQTPMVTVPYLAGKHGGARAMNAITEAYKPVVKALSAAKLKGLLEGQFDLDEMDLPADEAAALKKLQDAGLLDIGINTELGHWDRYNKDTSVVSQKFGDMIHKMQSVSRQVEVLNRTTAALAAYRLEKAKGANNDTAYAYAHDVVNYTHGDYTAFNAPRYFNKLPKIVTQFRKYQAIQVTLWAKLLHDAFDGKMSADDRKVARTTMGWLAGQTALFTGALALPAVSTAMFLGDLVFGDDDDPVDTERAIRKYIGNDDVANLILKGAAGLFNMDVSASMGFGQMLSVAPFADFDIKDRKSLYQMVGSMAGPYVGLMGNMADGLGYMRQGDTARGVELMLPTGLKSVIRTYREQTEGITRRNGDVVLSPDEMRFGEALISAIGFRTRTQDATARARALNYKYETAYEARTAQLKKDYQVAREAGDAREMQELRKSWVRLQESKKSNGFKPSPISKLLAATTEQQRRKRENDYRKRIENYK